MTASITRRSLLGALAASAAGSSLAGCGTPSVAVLETGRRELVAGAGAWCWFQSPRAIVDPHGQLWIGSTQGHSGPTPGAVEVTQVDLRTATVAARHRLATDRTDDHTSPSVSWVNGEIQVGWAPHRQVDWLEVGRIGTSGHQLQRLRVPDALKPPARGTAYVSAHQVGTQPWLLTRGPKFSWALFTQELDGQWQSRGLVVAPRPAGQRPYLLAAAKGDRLHFLVSSGNPTEYRGCHVAHGIVDDQLRIFDSTGRQVGRVGEAPASVDALTRVEHGRAGADELHDTDAWLMDLRVLAGRPTALLVVREPWPTRSQAVGGWRHRYRWARREAGGKWRVEHLAWAGSELYRRQPDYAGLATLDPTDPNRVVASTNVHPGTGEPLISAADGRIHWELFEGKRRDDQWRWWSLTRDSESDQLRPLIASHHHTKALVWMRGTYRSWMDFDTSIVVRID